MVDKRDLTGPRQPYPVGDTAHGQIVQANVNLPIIESVPNWTNEESLVVSSTVVQLNSAYRTSNNFCRITCEDAVIRYWVSGAVPSVTSGHILEPGDALILETSDEVNDVQFIRRDGTDATLMCSFGNR